MKARWLSGSWEGLEDGPGGWAGFVVDWQDDPEPRPRERRLVIKPDSVVPATAEEKRPDALASPEMVNILSQTFGNLGPYLGVVAWVNNVAYQKDVWLDIYGFNDDGDLVDSKQLALHYQAPAGGGGDLFGVHGLVGPDVASLAYRIYYEVNGKLFTDGRLHTAAVQRD